MKDFKYYIRKVIWLLFLVAVIVFYERYPSLLTLVSNVAFYSIALSILIWLQRKKTENEIKFSLDKVDHIITVWPLYILILGLFMLGMLQNIGYIKFSDFNNLIFSFIMGIYNLHVNEKNRKAKLEYEKSRQEMIEEYGQEEFERMEREADEFLEEIEREFINRK